MQFHVIFSILEFSFLTNIIAFSVAETSNDFFVSCDEKIMGIIDGAAMQCRLKKPTAPSFVKLRHLTVVITRESMPKSVLQC